jgi:alkylation response protein AidB-like acyl-CoA dehydrogenase
MSKPTQAELDDYRQDVAAWLKENRPPTPDFMLPLTFMEVGTREQFDYLRDWQLKCYEAGYVGASWPTEYGGGGLDQAFQTVASKEMATEGVPIMLNAIGLNWTGPLLLDIGCDKDRARYLKGILTAEDIWCQGFSEPDHGSDLGNAQTKAVRDGDSYIINGSKIWTTHGSFAKYMILLARTDANAVSKYKGLSFFLAPIHIPGVETTPIRKLTGEHGFTQTFFEGARISADCLMGEENGGWGVAMRTLEYERGARGGQGNSYTISMPDVSRIFALAKTAMRGGRPAVEDPVIRDQLVKFMIEARALGLNNLRQSITPLVQDRPHSLPLQSKLAWTEFIRRLNEFAMSLMGTKAAYYVGEPDVLDGGIWHRGYLNAFSATIGGGTSQIQRNIIGEHVLNLPKS